MLTGPGELDPPIVACPMWRCQSSFSEFHHQVGKTPIGQFSFQPHNSNSAFLLLSRVQADKAKGELSQS